MRLRIILGILALGMFATFAAAQSGPFTYQGSLKDGNAPANGQYDFVFNLYTAISGGSPVTAQIAVNDVQVTNGTFSVTLDFTVSPFGDLSGRYLEISVRPGASTGAYTLLTPRQQITNSPYSIRSTFSQNAESLGGVAANQFVITSDTRLSDARPPAAGSANYIQNGTGVQPSSDFNISGTGTVGGALSAGSVNAVNQFNLNGSRVISNVGFDNFFVGNGSGASNTGGFANAFFGYSAGQSNTGGTANSFVGRQAGFGNTGGSANTFIGIETGYFNTVGGGNAFVGAYSGNNNTTGSGNAFFGSSEGAYPFPGGTGRGNTTGSFNTFLGFRAGEINSTGSNNTLLGSNANLAAASMNFATAIGSGAVVTSSDTIVLGKVSGFYNDLPRPADVVIIPGNLNVIGTITGGAVNATQLGGVAANQFVQTSDSRLSDARAPTAGSANYIQSNPSGAQNASFNIVGNGNVAGVLSGTFVSAGTAFTMGNGNRAYAAPCFFCSAAGMGTGSPTGELNSFFGAGSGASTTSGSANAFFGSGNPVGNPKTGTGYSNTSGSFNSFFGHRAGEKNTVGSSNSYFGTGAGIAGVDGSENTFIGHDAGTANVAGSYNTLVGSGSNVGVNNLTNASAIGRQAFVTASNSLVLGSINGVNGAGAGTNVGIGTTAPTFKLHLKVDGQDGVKLQHTGVGIYPQVRWTDATDVFKASIGYGSGASEGMRFFLNGADRLTIQNDGLVRSTGGIYISQPNTVVITSPNGACWGITVSNAGALSTFSVPCP